ncbi:MAG: dTMP kinase [Nitrospinales bacterium]
MKLDRGYLIVFEGIDGTGKSTHCHLLTEYFQDNGLPVLRLREPTQGVWGRKIRNLLVQGRGGVTPEEELAWFINDRKEDVERNIRPALDQKKIILMDRYYFSTTAYQGALGLNPETILRENEAFAPAPDRVFIFTAPLPVCLERIRQSRNSGPDTFEKLEYLEKVQKIFDTFTGPRFRRVDSSASQEKVQARLRDEMVALFPDYLSR